MKNFDAYEYVALIAPGAVVAIAMFLQFPAFRDQVLSKEFSLGSLGVFLVCSFVLGHLVAAVGNMVERTVLRLTGGLPTNKVRSEKQKIISPSQRDRLIGKVKASQGEDVDLSTVGDDDWFAITRQIYADVAAFGGAARIDTFTRQYGMLRGIGSAFFLITIWLLVENWKSPIIAIAPAVGSLLAFARMSRFADTYARELFVQYVRLPDKNGAVDSAQASEVIDSKDESGDE